MDGNDGDNNCENIEKCEITRSFFFKTKTLKTVTLYENENQNEN